MSDNGSRIADIQAAWETEHAMYPKTEKETFVRNAMFSQRFRLGDLGAWAITQPDLHGVVMDSGFTSTSHFKPTGEADEETGTPWMTTDLSKPHVQCRISLEVVAENGQSKLYPPHPWERKYSWEDK